MKIKSFFSLILFFSLLLTSCAPYVEKAKIPPREGFYEEMGIASWYGKDFHGRKTANGERYNMYSISAAHKTLPFDTWVRVRNLDNGKTVLTRINDRGPFVNRRIIDLSYGAAREIDMVRSGIARVKVTVVKWGGKNIKKPRTGTYDSNQYSVQVGSFTKKENAIRLKESLENRFKNVRIVTRKTNQYTLYRVRVGMNLDRESAQKLAKRLEQENLSVFIAAE